MGNYNGTHTGPEIDSGLDDIAAHKVNVSNPHLVSKAQVGLSNVDNVKQLPIDGSAAMTGDLDMGGNNIINSGGVGDAYGECNMQANSTATTINSIGVFEDVEGTALAGLISDFTFAGGDNSLTYIGATTKVFRIIVAGSFYGQKDKDFVFSVAKNGVEQSKFRATRQSKDSTKEQLFTVSGLLSLATSDKINLVIENITNLDDPTIFDMNISVK